MPLVFKIAFKEGVKKVSGLGSNDEAPEKQE